MCAATFSVNLTPKDVHLVGTIWRAGGLGHAVCASLLTTIMGNKDDLKGLSINKVLWMLLSHNQQFGSFITKMSGMDRDALQIVDPKLSRPKLNPSQARKLSRLLPRRSHTAKLAFDRC